MIAEYNRKSLRIGIPGLLLQILGYIYNGIVTSHGNGNAMPFTTALLMFGELAGTVLLIIGLCYYSKAKGYSMAWGLLGLFSCIGLLILALLPDKTKTQG